MTLVIRAPYVSFSSLVAALRILRLSNVYQKTHKNGKENEHVKTLVFDVAATWRPCFSYGSLAVLFTTP